MADMPRAVLAAPDALAVLAARGFTYPFLLRAPGFHNGRNFFRIDSAAELPPALEALRSATITVMQFLDARGADGKIRKYRAMIVDGAIYPLHVAVSHEWKIHYVTADMTDNAGHRAEDEAFLRDMPAVLGPRAMASLKHIRDALDLDYAGIDFGLDAEGRVLLFEANATMVVVPPGSDERWNYRRAPTERILDAARRLVAKKAGL
jgi:glutathione synthase/RimK-type ligase-like ATP-grasp enzyme